MSAKIIGVAALCAACGLDNPSAPAPLDNRGVVTGQSVAKFCHELVRNRADIDLTLEFGQPVLARITARSGVCFPPVGQPCSSIPVGIVPVRLLEGDMQLAAGAFRLQPNLEYIFAAVVSGQTGLAAIRNGVFKPEFKCEATDPLADRDGGTPPDAGATDAAVD